MRTLVFVLSLFGLLQASAVPGRAAQTQICDAAAQYAAQETGVPLSILRAVTLAETGHTSGADRRFAAWPWAIQSGNRGDWFADQHAALAHVQNLMAQGTRNIDIGCFQLNLHWHGEAFQSLEEMISPQQNAIYAARFLQDLYQESGDWRIAVGRYHSRDDARAQAYVARLKTLFNTHLAAAPIDARVAAGETRARPQVPQRFGLQMARGPLIGMRTARGPLIGADR